MNRITQTLETLKQENKKALVSYIVNGDPTPEITIPAMHSLVESGADIIELGVPFSDPMAEGPVIQRGHERALTHGTSLLGTLDIVRTFRETNKFTPVVLMGYANPVIRMGYAEFAKNAAEAGVDGLLTVDLPPEEAGKLDEELQAVDIKNIFLIAPTTTEERIKEITAAASGFVYYVSLKGVTGAGHLDVSSIKSQVDTIRKYTTLPILVGFGIKDATSAKAVSELADGVVVGSILVKEMGENYSGSQKKVLESLKNIVHPIRAGLDN